MIRAWITREFSLFIPGMPNDFPTKSRDAIRFDIGAENGDSLRKDLGRRNLAHVEAVFDGKRHRVQVLSTADMDGRSTNQHEGYCFSGFPHQ